MLQFVTLISFYFSFGNIIFDILPDFSANIFFLPYHVCKQFIWSFQTLQAIFFNIYHLPASEKEYSVPYEQNNSKDRVSR